MDPVTQAIALLTEMYKAYNNQPEAVKLQQAADWQKVFDDTRTWFAALPFPIHLPPITVYIPPKS